MFTLIDGSYTMPIQNDYFTGSTNANAPRQRRPTVTTTTTTMTTKSAEFQREGDDFFVVAFYLVVRTTHFIAV